MEPSPSIQAFDLDDDATFARTVAAMKRVDDAGEDDDDDDDDNEGIAPNLQEVDEFAGLTKREAKRLRIKKRKAVTKIIRKERIKRRKEQEQSEVGIVPEKAVYETEYLFTDGFRRVIPYAYNFDVCCRPRWFGKPLAEAVAMDFRAYSPEHWVRACQAGLVQVNGRVASTSTILKPKDMVAFVSHRVHRHEPPVTDQKIKIIHEDDRILALDKPASIPIHPSGRYRHNTIVFILAHERGQRHLWVVHRLDRLTSGILILAKKRSDAESISEKIRSSAVQKEYLARVEGVFPEETIEVDQPILIDAGKTEISQVHPSGKPSQTTFTRLATNGKESLVRCLPKTGRTHQIRVHLQWLGFPITNDPLYNPRVSAARGSVLREDDDGQDSQAASESTVPWVVGKTFLEGEEIDLDTLDPIPACPDCHGYDPSSSRFKDPSKDEMCIYLHALSYRSDEWAFKTEEPAWAML